jgi:hypothetical protein
MEESVRISVNPRLYEEKTQPERFFSRKPPLAILPVPPHH